MKMVVMGSRRSGKTRAAIHWLADAPPGKKRILISHNEFASSATWHMAAIDMGLDVERSQFVHCDPHSLRGLDWNTYEFGADEIEYCKDIELVVPVSFATSTLEETA